MTDETCRVAEHEVVGAGYRRLVLEAPQIAAEVLPGQFVHVRVPALEASALRRPFSVFNADDGRVELLYKTVGRGTAALNGVRVGDEVKVMGPLGHGFPETCAGVALLVGGGYGIAPLYFLARRLVASGMPRERVQLFAGGRTQADLLALDRFAAIGVKANVATNDGSAGVKGLDRSVGRCADRAARAWREVRAVRLRAGPDAEGRRAPRHRHRVKGVDIDGPPHDLWRRRVLRLHPANGARQFALLHRGPGIRRRGPRVGMRRANVI